MGEPTVFDTALFSDLADEAQELLSIDDAARAEVWASGILGIWREPGAHAEPDRIDAAFIAHLVDRPTASGRALLAALAGVGPAASAAAARAALGASADPNLGSLPPWASAVGTAAVVGAAVLEHEGRTVALDFVHEDGSSHCLLADIEDGRLADLVFGPGLDQIRVGSGDAAEPLALVDAEPGQVAAELTSAWRALVASGEVPTDNVLMNQAAAEARLRSILGARATAGLLDGWSSAPAGYGSGPVADDGFDVDPSDAELDRYAVELLQSALAAHREAPAPVGQSAAAELVAGVADLVAGRVSGPSRDAAAVRALEWADWLGALIPLVRAGPGAPADPDQLVDNVNRCPEITSVIPHQDREYFSFAFAVVVAELDRLGLLTDGRLNPVGMWVLPRALARAWGGTF